MNNKFLSVITANISTKTQNALICRCSSEQDLRIETSYVFVEILAVITLKNSRYL